MKIQEIVESTMDSFIAETGKDIDCYRTGELSCLILDNLKKNGYKVVPIVPTPKMMVAGQRDWDYGDKHTKDIWYGMINEVDDD